MKHQDRTPPVDLVSRAEERAWDVVVACAQLTEALVLANRPAMFSATEDGSLQPVLPGETACVVAWRPEVGWQACLPPGDPRCALIDLYLPICSATRERPVTVGHLGQSLDGFIATLSGDSHFVTGKENIRHLHRMRALCDAIIVGAGTVAADDPQLTTRQVSGPSPVRVVLDPTRRLSDHYKVFRDDAVETLYVCARSLVRPGERTFGQAAVVAAEDTPDGIDVTEVVALLHRRGCHRIFVEGGGVTVSMFLEARLLDRLQVAIAPLIIGDGRPAIRLPARVSLRDCIRPTYRVFRMGGDVFFDCELAQLAGEPDHDDLGDDQPSVSRVI